MILVTIALASLLTFTSPEDAAMTITLPASDGSHRLYDHPNGGLEWEITLVRPIVSYSEPAETFPERGRQTSPSAPTLESPAHDGSVLFTYPFTSANLTFHYQDTLSTAELLLGAYRPDSVIGSWAVFDRHGRKLWHIFRPRAWDSDGDTVWCSLDLDLASSSLTLAVPMPFLDHATYPVTIDPHFGVDRVGASGIGFYNNYNYALALDDYQHTAGPNEVVDSLALYFVYAGDSAAIAVYEANGAGTPVDAPFGQSARIGSTANDQWVVVDVNIPLTEGMTYTLALADLMSDGTRVAYDSYTDACSRCVGGSFCDPWSEASRRTYLFSAYAVYTTVEAAQIKPSRRKTIIEGFNQ